MTIYLTQIELSRRWQISPRTLEGWRYRQDNGPSFVRIGRSVRYPMEQIERSSGKNSARSLVIVWASEVADQGFRRSAQIKAEKLVTRAANAAMREASNKSMAEGLQLKRESVHVSHAVSCRTAKVRLAHV